MFERLSIISDKYNINIVLENDALSTLFSNSDILINLFKRNNKIKACLDIGRLHLQEKLDSSFNALEFFEKLAPYAFSVHLWNTNPMQNLSGGHYPVLPEQKPSEGWADIGKFIEIIKRYNSKIKIVFEHRSDLINDDDLDRCYEWIKELLKK